MIILVAKCREIEMFVGRKEYLDDLESLWRKRTSSIIACRGRRRIGKSTLFREFARRTAEVYMEFEGLAPNPDHPVTNEDQLGEFAATLARITSSPILSLPNWKDAFFWLDRAIDDSKKTVILLDEISWMGGCDPTFPAVLRNAWETWFHRHEKLIFVVCGSVSAWIKKNILGNTGFTGRFSRDYVLRELSLPECAEFWKPGLADLNPREVFDVLSVTGGVPRYLEEVDPGLSAEENIRRLCFKKEGELFKDFDAIFNPIFGAGVMDRRRILELLAEGPMSGAEMAPKLGLDRNGALSDRLRELEEGGFIDSDPGLNPETGREARISRYRLRDNYTRFYLKYVMPRKSLIERGAYRFASLSALPDWNTVMGLQFENLIVNNAMDVATMMGIGNTTIESAAPYRNFRKDRNGKTRGCQIDLLIQTPKTAYVVEVKRRGEIGPEIEEEVRERMKRLPLRTGMSKRPVLVYDGQLDPVVEGSGFFAALVSGRKLLGL